MSSEWTNAIKGHLNIIKICTVILNATTISSWYLKHPNSLYLSYIHNLVYSLDTDMINEVPNRRNKDVYVILFFKQEHQKWQLLTVLRVVSLDPTIMLEWGWRCRGKRYAAGNVVEMDGLMVVQWWCGMVSVYRVAVTWAFLDHVA